MSPSGRRITRAECSGRCNERQGRGVCDCDEGRMTDSDRALRAAVWLGVLLFDAAVFVFLVNV